MKDGFLNIMDKRTFWWRGMTQGPPREQNLGEENKDIENTILNFKIS